MQFVRRDFHLPEYPLARVQELIQLRALLRTMEINCVLDVGANRGQFAHDLRDIGYRGHIVSFEPVMSEFETLSASFAHDPKWRGFPIALGEQSSTLVMNVVPNQTVASSLLTPLVPCVVEKRPVEVKRLDEVFAEAMTSVDKPRVLLKLDTQGYDVNVFAGAAGCLDSIMAIQSELSVSPVYEGMAHYLAALSLYETHGFELVSLALVCRTSSGGLGELNCLLKRCH